MSCHHFCLLTVLSDSIRLLPLLFIYLLPLTQLIQFGLWTEILPSQPSIPLLRLGKPWQSRTLVLLSLFFWRKENDKHKYKLIYSTSLQASRKIKLSRQSSPCEPSEDYDFNSCVNNGIAKNLGCKPFWILKNPNRLTNCTEAKDITRYLHELKSTSHMDEKSLLDRYSCLKPCSYMEYKVIDEDKDCNILNFGALPFFHISTFFSFFLSWSDNLRWYPPLIQMWQYWTYNSTVQSSPLSRKWWPTLSAPWLRTLVVSSDCLLDSISWWSGIVFFMDWNA